MILLQPAHVLGLRDAAPLPVTVASKDDEPKTTRWDKDTGAL